MFGVWWPILLVTHHGHKSLVLPKKVFWKLYFFLSLSFEQTKIQIRFHFPFFKWKRSYKALLMMKIFQKFFAHCSLIPFLLFSHNLFIRKRTSTNSNSFSKRVTIFSNAFLINWRLRLSQAPPNLSSNSVIVGAVLFCSPILQNRWSSNFSFSLHCTFKTWKFSS